MIAITKNEKILLTNTATSTEAQTHIVQNQKNLVVRCTCSVHGQLNQDLNTGCHHFFQWANRYGVNILEARTSSYNPWIGDDYHPRP